MLSRISDKGGRKSPELMDLRRLRSVVERLREASIGDPQWVSSKGVFEYPRRTLEVVVVLKLVRAAQGVHAMTLLCENGLFVDMGAIYRCVSDCVNETYFLLEDYPEQSGLKEKYLTHFFSQTIETCQSFEEEAVRSRKIHNAAVRVMTGREQDKNAQEVITRIYKTFSGYTHAGYAHIMEMFGGASPDVSFNISGIPSEKMRERNMELVFEAYKSVLSATAFTAGIFGLKELFREIRTLLQEADSPFSR